MAKRWARLPVIPVRESASHRSEQVTQLLFGESFTIGKAEGDFLPIKMDWDGYEGYISTNQVEDKEPCHDREIIKTKTSPVPGFPHLRLSPGSEVCVDEAPEIQPPVEAFDLNSIIKTFLGVPYLWGGRSIWGIDCSGFVQVIAKMYDMQLPRDASQQVDVGHSVHFNDAKQGDLAFFEEKNRITHVGIVMDDQSIVHAAGCVKIDQFTAEGIIDKGGKKTHDLTVINRVDGLFG
jgi:cell wall-associated NlpC family hydrolase